MERRSYPRHLCSENPKLKVSVLLSGGSLIGLKSPHLVELEGRPLDVSRGGLSLSFDFDPDLSSLEPPSKVDLVLRYEGCKKTARAQIVHVHEGHRRMGLSFVQPLETLTDLGIV
ncbi:MAG: hypothetical protein A2053_06140 [Deltaproteobacteria bacterium GWA2_50_8]|nr:MAG: hypothetical protein A2053_06140 [Deltaproteobacteria bacterium GWA2_50_8]